MLNLKKKNMMKQNKLILHTLSFLLFSILLSTAYGNAGKVELLKQKTEIVKTHVASSKKIIKQPTVPSRKKVTTSLLIALHKLLLLHPAAQRWFLNHNAIALIKRS